MIRREDARLRAGDGSGKPRSPLPRLPQVPAGRCDGPRQVHVPRAHQGSLSAVELLDGDDLHGARALGSRGVLCPAGHGRGRPERSTSGRWARARSCWPSTTRTACRSWCATRTTGASRIPCEGAPGDKEAGLLDDCGKKTPVRRQDRDRRRARAGAAARQVPPGLLRPRGVRAAPTRGSSTSSRSRIPRRSARPMTRRASASIATTTSTATRSPSTCSTR